MTYAERLVLELDKARQDLAQLREKLRGRISPGRAIDQLVEYAQDGAGAEFVDDFKRQAINNPVPVTLIGTGIAWLMLSGSAKPRMPSYNSQTRSLADRAGDPFDSFGQSRCDAGASAKAGASGVSGTVARFRDRASGLASSTYQSASDTFDSVSEHAANTSAVVGVSARNLGQGAAETSRLLMQFCREQLYVLAGLEVALGAALGAMLPGTDAESRLLGEFERRAEREHQRCRSRRIRRDSRRGRARA